MRPNFVIFDIYKRQKNYKLVNWLFDFSFCNFIQKTLYLLFTEKFSVYFWLNVLKRLNLDSSHWNFTLIFIWISFNLTFYGNLFAVEETNQVQ